MLALFKIKSTTEVGGSNPSDHAHHLPPVGDKDRDRNKTLSCPIPGPQRAPLDCVQQAMESDCCCSVLSHSIKLLNTLFPISRKGVFKSLG